MITFWSMVLWILAVATLGTIGFAGWYVYMCLGFFFALKRTNVEFARAKALTDARFARYPKLRVEGRAFNRPRVQALDPQAMRVHGRAIDLAAGIAASGGTDTEIEEVRYRKHRLTMT